MPRSIKIQCPTCNQRGFIDIADGLIDKVERGLLAVNVSEQICEHSFIVYLDKNLTIRDYFIADFQITIPEQDAGSDAESDLKAVMEVLDLDLLKMNLTPALITYLLKSIFLKKHIVMISEQTFLYNHVLALLQFVFQDTFEYDITLLPIDDYMKTKKRYKVHLVLGRNEVLRDDDKIIDLKGLKTEKKIVDKFFGETNLMSSLIILKNEISKIYDQANDIVNFISKYESESGSETQEKFSNKLVIEHFKKERDLKISVQELNYLLEIVQKYFEAKLPDSSGIKDFLGFI